MFPESLPAAAHRRADELRQLCANHPFIFEGSRLSVTVSAGVANLLDHKTPAELFAAADAALYRAKRGGRNRVVSADTPALPIATTPSPR